MSKKKNIQTRFSRTGRSRRRDGHRHYKIHPQVFGNGRSKAMMEYKGYIGKVEIDEEAGILHGEVINIRDVVTFEGQTVEELQLALRDSVDDYLIFCAERGEEPEKPFSGKFVIRVPAELHRKAYIKAKLADQSLNSWVTTVLETATREEA
jgi:predicted HicB family RNase H-like nuclease